MAPGVMAGVAATAAAPLLTVDIIQALLAVVVAMAGTRSRDPEAMVVTVAAPPCLVIALQMLLAALAATVVTQSPDQVV